MATFLGIVFSFLILCTAHATPLASDCVQDVLCIDREDLGDTVKFYARNLSEDYLTLTIEARLTNASLDAALPLNRTLKGGARIELLALKQKIKNKPWYYQYDFRYHWGAMHPELTGTEIYRLPFEIGKSFFVSQGNNESYSHNGPAVYAFDWAMPEGTQVFAVQRGKIVQLRDEFAEGAPDLRLASKSNLVMVLHKDGSCAVYEHLKYKGVVVRLGATVNEGELLGYSGNTGFSSEPHLHFEIQRRIDGSFAYQTMPIKFRAVEGNGIVPLSGKPYTAN